MTEQWIELGRRAVACKGWRWMRGMVDILTDLQCVAAFDDGCSSWADTAPEAKYQTGRASGFDAVPDFRDPATLGCLLALVREAWDMDALVTHQGEDDMWGAGSWVDCRLFTIAPAAYLTEAEALVAALEVAP